MPRSEAYILQKTKHGNRLRPTTLAQAEELVGKSQAKKLKAGFYDGTVAAPAGLPEQETRQLSTPSKASGSRSKRS